MSSEKGKTFALTLGNPQLCRLYKDTQLAVLRYVDFLFSNAEVLFQILTNSQIDSKTGTRFFNPGSQLTYTWKRLIIHHNNALLNKGALLSLFLPP